MNIVELGIGGDTIVTLKNRADMVSAVTPEKIFVMIGINRLKENSQKLFEGYYRSLMDTLKEDNSNAQIYIQSVLPVSQEMEEKYCRNTVIRGFNSSLAEIAVEYGAKYIDLNSAFTANGYMNADYTTDGVHLTEKGYDVWAQVIKTYIYE